MTCIVLLRFGDFIFHQFGIIGVGVVVVENNCDIDQVIKYLDLTIIASVEEGKDGAKMRLNQLETNFQNRLMTMYFHGGLNVRDDSKRGNK